MPVVQNYSKTGPKSLGYKWFGCHLVFGPFEYLTTKSLVFKGFWFSKGRCSDSHCSRPDYCNTLSVSLLCGLILKFARKKSMSNSMSSFRKGAPREKGLSAWNVDNKKGNHKTVTIRIMNNWNPNIWFFGHFFDQFLNGLILRFGRPRFKTIK